MPSVGHAHGRTSILLSERSILGYFVIKAANLRASAGGRLSRMRRNSTKSRAVAGTNWLNSRQAVGVLMPQASRDALLITSTELASTMRLLQL